MGFDKHLFISYAHLDNEPLTDQQQGWITRFHAALSTLLSMRMGRKAEIWRDSKLRGNDIFADEIVQQFPKTALLVSVLTPRYGRSPTGVPAKSVNSSRLPKPPAAWSSTTRPASSKSVKFAGRLPGDSPARHEGRPRLSLLRLR